MSATSIPADINRKHLEMARQQISKDRKSTRLNSSHLVISYAVFCLKKKKQVVPAVVGPQCGHRGQADCRQKAASETASGGEDERHKRRRSDVQSGNSETSEQNQICAV